MKNLHTFFALLFMATLIAFGLPACSDDEEENEPEPEPTTISEDKENIEEVVNTTTIDCIDQFINKGDFAKALSGFLGMSSGEATNEAWVDDLFTALEDSDDFSGLFDGDRFNYGQHEGVYTYNDNNHTFSKSGKEGIVEIKFPGSPSANDNNMTLTLHNYKDKRIRFDKEELSLPTQMRVTLDKSGTKIGEVILNNATYDQNANIQIPIEVDLKIFMDPHNLTIKGRKASNNKWDMNMNMSDGSCNILEADLQATTSDVSYENFIFGNDINNISGTIKTNNLTFKGDADLATLNSLDDPSVTQINTAISMDVLMNGQKVGNLQLADNEEDVNIVYKDGTKEDVMVAYLNTFLDKLELKTAKWTGSW